jgi:hypothetical protein
LKMMKYRPEIKPMPLKVMVNAACLEGAPDPVESKS